MKKIKFPDKGSYPSLRVHPMFRDYFENEIEPVNKMLGGAEKIVRIEEMEGWFNGYSKKSHTPVEFAYLIGRHKAEPDSPEKVLRDLYITFDNSGSFVTIEDFREFMDRAKKVLGKDPTE